MLRLSLLAALAVAPVAWAQGPEAPSFRVDVKLVTVLATVQDATGSSVADLGRGDFTVLAAGVRQQLAVFERQTDRPLSVVLLFDASPSVTKERKFEQEAARRFVRSLLGSGAQLADRVAVYAFSSHVEEVQGFTASLPRLERAVLGIQPRSGTSVYDALYLAAQALAKRQGRRVIVILTDGGDTTSGLAFAQAIEACQTADIVLYSIVIVPITRDPGRNLGGENALKTLSANTGGLAFLQHEGADFDQAFRRIERDLRTQYLLGFYPRDLPPSPERFRRIDVEIGRPGLRVLARSGYYAPADEAARGAAPAAVSVEGPPSRGRKKAAPPQPSRPKKGTQLMLLTPQPPTPIPQPPTPRGRAALGCGSDAL